MSIRKLNHKGDTIVEVMIVTVVLSVVIGSIYKIATASLQSTQLTQERTYALKLAETQMERLKAVAIQNPGSNIFTASQGFCIKGDASYTKQDLSNGAPTLLFTDDNLSTSDYPPDCREDVNDPVAKSCTSYCYFIGVKRSANPLGDDSFTASVRWYGPRGVKEQATLAYKVYK